MEPSIGSPKGGSGGSRGPNELGARVGLPPGIPLAMIAGPWVTRKLGGRWRTAGTARSVTPVHQHPQPDQSNLSPSLHHPRWTVHGDAAGSPVPLLGARPLTVVATKSSSQRRLKGRGQPVGTARPKSEEEGKPGRLRVGTGTKSSGL
ncbi:hypothetical protein NN561_008545 [Cricetulus griseus]